MSHAQEFKDFSEAEHQTWRELFSRQAPLRAQQMVPRFSRGLEALGIDGSGIPDLHQVNRKLKERTGFVGVPVEGFEKPSDFFVMLERREFPVGNFIRDARDLNYTPAPDVFHDLYGHLPFLIEKDYADFCQDFGKRGARWANDERALTEFDRLFWFTIEFALEQTASGPRIFGAGIASSFSECAYALGPGPEVLPFDLEVIRNQEFRIDQMQKRLFRIPSARALFSCLDDFEAGINRKGERS